MGGLGSGRKRWGYRASTVEESLTLEISGFVMKLLKSTPQILPNGTLNQGDFSGEFGFHKDNDGLLMWVYVDYIDIIRFKQTYPHFGGVRWWFACPSCHRGVSKLYLLPNAPHFHCRTCHHLTYRSCQESRNVCAQLDRRIRRWLKKLGGRQNPLYPFVEVPDKPKWMRWETYLQICLTISALELRREQVFVAEARKLSEFLRKSL